MNAALRYPDGRIDSRGDVFLYYPANPSNRGAKGDAISISDANIVGGTDVLTSASNPFKASDVGKVLVCMVAGLAGVPLVTRIVSVTNAGTVVLADVSVGGASNVVASFGTDDSQAFKDAIAAAVAYDIPFITGPGRYLLASQLVLPSKLVWNGSAETTLVGALNWASPNHVNDLLYAGPVFNSFTTTLAANIVQWSVSVSLTAAPAIGDVLWIVSAGGATEHASAYTVKSVSAGPGPYTVEVDRPICLPYLAAGAAVKGVASLPKDIAIHGNGLLITGTCARYYELLGASDSLLEDINFDSSGGTAFLVGSIDEGCRNTWGNRLIADMVVHVPSGTPNIGFWSESCEHCGYSECSARGIFQLSFACYDSAFFVLDSCESVGDGTHPTEANIKLGTNGTAFAQSCSVIDGSYRYGANAAILVAEAHDSFISGSESGPQKTGATSFGISIGPASVRTVVEGLSSIRCTYGAKIEAGAVDARLAQCSAVDCTKGYETAAVARANQCRYESVTANGVAGADIGFISDTGGAWWLNDCDVIHNNPATLGCLGYYCKTGAFMSIDNCRNSFDAALSAGGTGVLAEGTGAKVYIDNFLLGGVHASDANVIGLYMYAAGSTMRIGDNVNVAAATTPTSFVNTSFPNRGTIQLNGATPVNVAFPDLRTTDTVKVTLTTVAGTQGLPPSITQTPATGFAIAGIALDTSTYLYEVS